MLKISKLSIATDSTSSQYRIKFNCFLTKHWAIEHKIDVYWVFTESGHGKGPMDGIGGRIKSIIKDTIAYRPDVVISKTDELLYYLPATSGILIGTYTGHDVKKYSSRLPTHKNLSIISSIGLSKVHEVFFSKKDDKLIKWKALSSDIENTIARLKVIET